MASPDNAPPNEGFLNALARWAGDGWAGRAPLRPVFWGGGAVWFFGYGIERGLVHLFLLPQSPFYMGISQTLASLMRLTEWVLLGVFIWWCISVWRCADKEAMGVFPVTAKGVVVLLVVANAVTAMMSMMRGGGP